MGAKVGVLRPAPDPNVLAWMDSWPADELATTAVCAAELWHGVARLPDGRRKTALAYVEVIAPWLDR
ncbi:hypothetical protein [Nocardia vulneris]|uniref:hypothetical protein n=1 Tax=Nocardia vulneris TaxID=1141657 RepID=UPI0005BC0327|nr:hypothetical protein [Nocardia vulneris]